jgi:hypothetical protein
MLYVESGSGEWPVPLPTSGKQGEFTLAAPLTAPVALRWGTAHGPTLTLLPVPPAGSRSLGWQGQVIVGGFIDRIHACEIGGLEVAIVEVVGGAFAAGHTALPSLTDMRGGVFARPSNAEPHTSGDSFPLIALAESSVAALAQDALVSGLAVDAYGRLADEAGGWHEALGLPLLLEALTLFGRNG